MTNAIQTARDAEATFQLDRASSQLMMQQPFFAALLFRLVRRERLDIPTMSVDGVHLDYNPDFVRSLPLPQLIGVLAHEVSHLAGLHHTRRGGRDPKTWNDAADYAVNPIVLAAGLELPPGALVDPDFADMSAEEIYARLAKKQDQQQQQDQQQPPQAGNGPGQGQAQQDQQGQDPAAPDPARCGAVADAPKPAGEAHQTQANIDAQEADWKVAVIQAQQAAKAAGKMPGELAEAINEIKRPRIDWREQLRRFFTANDRTDYAWTPPNRRFISRGLYLPSLRTEEMGEMVLAVDTSGSLDKDELTMFAAELNGIIDEVRPRLIHVVYCDFRVRHTEEFTREDFNVQMQAPGRGGTRFTPVFDWIAANHIDPACLVYLTDLDCDDFPAEPHYPTLWVSTFRNQAPFGEVIKLVI